MNNSSNSSSCFANYVVISLLPVLFFMFILVGYLGFIPLQVPIHALGIVFFILFIFMLFIQHNANYSICKIRASFLQFKQDLEYKMKMNELHIEGKTKSMLDIKTYLNSYYKSVRNDNFASVASSIFPMLGILGTFIAIAISMPNFSVSDTQALDHEISLLLSGVGSAFFASIFGIFLSLIWTYFEKRGMSKIESYFHSIEESYESAIWSKDELLIYKYTQYDLKENKFIGALKETFSLEFIEKINKEHTDNFSQISNNLRSVAHDIKTTLSHMNTTNSALQAQEHIDKSLIDFAIATKSFEKSSKMYSAQLDNSLNRTFDKIDNEIGKIVIELADFATHVSLESREVQESISKYHEMVARETRAK